MTLRLALNDITDASDATEQIENTDANDPIEPIDSAEPTEPIDRTEPREPIDRSESSDQSDHFEVPDADMSSVWRSPFELGRDEDGAIRRECCGRSGDYSRTL